jgi:hypothetical protein
VAGAEDESLPPPPGAWQVIFGVGSVVGSPGAGVLDGVTVSSPGGQLPLTTCEPLFVGRGELGLGEPLGTGVEESSGRTWPWDRPLFCMSPPLPPVESGLKWPVWTKFASAGVTDTAAKQTTSAAVTAANGRNHGVE